MSEEDIFLPQMPWFLRQKPAEIEKKMREINKFTKNQDVFVTGVPSSNDSPTTLLKPFFWTSPFLWSKGDTNSNLLSSTPPTSKTKGMTMRPISSSVGAGRDLMPMALRIFSNHAASNKEAADVSSCGTSDDYFQGYLVAFRDRLNVTLITIRWPTST